MSTKLRIALLAGLLSFFTPCSHGAANAVDAKAADATVIVVKRILEGLADVIG